MSYNAALNRLDHCAGAMRLGEEDGYWVLSTGERLYVALAANRADLLEADCFTIPQALQRIGLEWASALAERWS